MDKSEKFLFSRIMDVADKIINVVCVCMLCVQVAAIILMVFGRYFFQYVPRGTEELALLCMVWFSLISLSMSVRDDSHIKMEIADMVFKRETIIRWFRLFSSIVMFAFSVYMVYYGAKLVELTMSTKMSGIGVSQGWLYAPIPVGGFFMAFASIALVIESFWKERKKDV